LLAVAVHKGSFADLHQTYRALGTYVAERGTGLDRPIREHYLVTAFDTDDESRHVTEVGWPVFRPGRPPDRARARWRRLKLPGLRLLRTVLGRGRGGRLLP
jgi:GyrI-like small molecule binding domain